MRRPKIFYGWWIVAVSLVADGMKHGSFNRGFTVLYIPIEDSLGFSRTMLGLAEGLGRMMGGIQGPVMGYCTDRFGPRVMLAFGGLMSGLGFILLGFTGSYWYFLVVFVGFMSVGFRSGYNNASIAAVNNWFWRRRGLAMSVVSMGNGLGGATAPLVGLLIFAVGWRDACTVLGVAILAVVIPLSWFLRRSPEEMGLLPDGDTPETVAAAGNRSRQVTPQQRRRMQFGETDFTAREAMRTPSYWLLVMSTAFRNIVHAGRVVPDGAADGLVSGRRRSRRGWQLHHHRRRLCGARSPSPTWCSIRAWAGLATRLTAASSAPSAWFPAPWPWLRC